MVWPLLAALVVGAAAPSFLGGTSAAEAIGPAVGGAYTGIKKASKGNAYEISTVTTVILISLYLFNRMIK